MDLAELCLYMSSNSHMKLRIKLHVESMKLKLRFQLQIWQLKYLAVGQNKIHCGGGLLSTNNLFLFKLWISFTKRGKVSWAIIHKPGHAKGLYDIDNNRLRKEERSLQNKKNRILKWKKEDKQRDKYTIIQRKMESETQMPIENLSSR